MVFARRRGGVLLGCLLLALSAALSGCSRAEPRASPATEDALIVFAAASLRDVFTALGREFEREHAGATLTFNFAGTQELRTQLEHGAPADVFASADQRHMTELAARGRVVSPAIFARNELVLVVADFARETIRTFADLPRAERIVVGAPEVPIGRYTAQVLERAETKLGLHFRSEVAARIASRELNVRQVLAKVSLGEADAGIVYRSDVHASQGRVQVVAIPSELNALADYPIAVVTGAPHPALAAAWLALVQSARGQALLRNAGFLPPN